MLQTCSKNNKNQCDKNGIKEEERGKNIKNENREEFDIGKNHRIKKIAIAFFSQMISFLFYCCFCHFISGRTNISAHLFCSTLVTLLAFLLCVFIDATAPIFTLPFFEKASSMIH